MHVIPAGIQVKLPAQRALRVNTNPLPADLYNDERSACVVLFRAMPSKKLYVIRKGYFFIAFHLASESLIPVHFEPFALLCKP